MFENLGKIIEELERSKKKRQLIRVPPGEYAGEKGVPVMESSGSSARDSRTGSWRVFKPVIDSEKCTGCGICWLFCPDSAIKKGDGKLFIDYSVCKGCLICVNECPVKAIHAERDLHLEDESK